MALHDELRDAKQSAKTHEAICQSLIAENKQYRAEIDRLNSNIKSAYAILQMYGVPELRAKSVANGIQVLVSRIDKEIVSLRAELQIVRVELAHLQASDSDLHFGSD